LPIRVGSPPSPSTIELMTHGGLTLRFPIDLSSDTLVNFVRRLEDIPC
jgi:hypothetical protein